MKIKLRTSLYSIAQQCPLTGGAAVYWARSLYAQYQPDATYDDKVTCAAQGILARQQAPNTAPANTVAEKLEIENLDNVLLTPNPANNVASIIFPVSFTGSIEIFDIAGKKVLYKTMANQSHVDINTTGLHNGMYSVKISLNNDFKVYKLNVLH